LDPRIEVNILQPGQANVLFEFPQRCLNLAACAADASTDSHYAISLRIHIKDVLPTPTGGIGVVLDGAEPPFSATSHGINRDAPQEAHFAVVSCAEPNAVDQSFQIREIAFAADLNANKVAVCIVLVAVDGIADLPQVAAKLGLLLPGDRKTKNWQRR
jgi:hypothetical protein